MSFLGALSILMTSLTLTLALGFLLLLIWYDAGRLVHQLLSIFVIAVVLWSLGILILRGLSLTEIDTALLSRVAIGGIEVGFVAATITIYGLVALLLGVSVKYFRLLILVALFTLVSLQVLLIVITPSNKILGQTSNPNQLIFSYQPSTILIYLLFSSAIIYLITTHKRKLQSTSMLMGLILFILGQGFQFINPDLHGPSISINLASIAVLIIIGSFFQQELIRPLREQQSQVETLHHVSLSITSQISIDTVLSEIATQAAGWLGADAVGIFLNRGRNLELVAVHNMPPQYIHKIIPLGTGITGKVALHQESIHLDNYQRDWNEAPDLPLAAKTFGSTICVPLIYGSQTIGVLLVVTARQGRLFQAKDVHLLELLGSQAAVAIAHSQLFANQQALTEEVEAAKNQLETVLLSTENPVIVVNQKLRLTFANPSAQRLFTLNISNYGQPIYSLIKTESLPQNYVNVLRRFRDAGVFTYELTASNKILLCHLAPLEKDGRLSGWVAVLNDITKLKELDRIKSEMIRMTSHDLKNPLQAAMANLELLEDDIAEISNPDIQKSARAINKQLDRMNRIISGILDLERVQSGTPRMEQCIPAMIIERVTEEVHSLAEERDIKLHTKISNTVTDFYGDPEQFKRALVNLAENALKFTSPKGRVHISVSNDNNNNIIFEIMDTGIGIPEKQQSKVFDRFFRAEQEHTKHVSGTGLGLSLVKTVVENHNGEVWFKSTEGVGTIFFVSIPATKKQTTEQLDTYETTL